MPYAKIEDWLHETEGFGLRLERIPEGAMEWIALAWQFGAEAENEACAEIAALIAAKASQRVSDGNEKARQAALDKFESALEIVTAIRERSTETNK